MSKLKHIHILGICGTAMGSLAQMLKELNYKVTGSDQNVYPPMSTKLNEIGIKIYEGYKASNLDDKPDMVVIGNVVTAKNPEAVAVVERKLPYTSMPAALEEFVFNKRSTLMATGTHGKTTTSSMLAWVLDNAKKEPGFMIGGILKNFNYSARVGAGDYFAIEGDEYDTVYYDKTPKFIHYNPKYVICSSIEFDHADIYRDLDHVKEAFEMLFKMMPADGVLVYNKDDENILSILDLAKCKKVSYSLKDENADWYANDIKVENDAYVFSVKNYGKIILPMIGKHNVLNALSAVALLDSVGLSKEEIQNGFKTFKGIKRRQEIIGKSKGRIIIDDFAHHPTAVNYTVEAVRDFYKGKRVWCVYEPRTATARRNVFYKEYMEAFMKADDIIMANVHRGSEVSDEERFSPEAFIKDLASKGKNAHFFEEVDQIVDFIDKNTKNDDIVLIMSNGGFGNIYSKILQL